jgi:hypothetical protein
MLKSLSKGQLLWILDARADVKVKCNLFNTSKVSVDKNK